MEATATLGGSTLLFLVLLFVSIAGVAFFSSAEASLLSINKFRVRHLAVRGNKGAQAAHRVLQQHERFFAAILLTENALIILASSVSTALAIAYFGGNGAAIVVASLVMTVLIVIFGEITPKSMAAQFADRWALVVARPIELVIRLESLVLYLFTALPRVLNRLLGNRRGEKVPPVTEGELRMLVGLAHRGGEVREVEARLLDNVFRFGDRRVREVMTPRIDVPAIKEGTTAREFLNLFQRDPQSRMLVYRESIDNVVGVVETRSVLASIAAGHLAEGEPVTKLAEPPFFTMDAKLLPELLDEMQSQGALFAVALDEFGGVAGAVSIAQVLEPLVGPLTTEDVEEGAAVVRHSDDDFELNGDLSVEEASERLKVPIPKGDYDTVAGLVLAHLGHIPVVEEEVQVGELVFRVVRMKGRRITRVHLNRTVGAEPLAVEEYDDYDD